MNRARTAPRGAPFRFQVERQEGGASERVVVTGSLPAGSPAQPVARSVADPTRYAGAVFRMQLEAVGIELAGEVRVAPAPAGAAHVYDYYGPSVAEVLVPFLKWSHNVIGETLCKDLALERGAARGSWAEGAQALRGELARLGLDGGLAGRRRRLGTLLPEPRVAAHPRRRAAARADALRARSRARGGPADRRDRRNAAPPRGGCARLRAREDRACSRRWPPSPDMRKRPAARSGSSRCW